LEVLKLAKVCSIEERRVWAAINPDAAGHVFHRR
jgi:hypothetical protein